MAKRRPLHPARRVAVIGLGRFGASLAAELVREGVDVVGFDSDPGTVQRYTDDLPNSAIVDSTDPAALVQLGVADFDHVAVCIGSDLEASILTVSAVADLGVTDLWAKATSRQHGRILERVGAHHVVLPEHDMGERVAHLVTGRRMLDYIEFDEEFAIAKAPAPRELFGVTLKSSRVRNRFGVTIVAVRRPGGGYEFAGLDTVIGEDDLLIVSGPVRSVERFAARH